MAKSASERMIDCMKKAKTEKARLVCKTAHAEAEGIKDARDAEKLAKETWETGAKDSKRHWRNVGK